MGDHNELGRKGEELASRYLVKEGYHLQDRNWRHHKMELDIIARKDQQLVVIEVKSRSSNGIERPQDAVTIPKQKRIVKAADAYVLEMNIDLECRFDIISVVFNRNGYELEHIEDAFSTML